jgi:hypothetical protein
VYRLKNTEAQHTERLSFFCFLVATTSQRAGISVSRAYGDREHARSKFRCIIKVIQITEENLAMISPESIRLGSVCDQQSSLTLFIFQTRRQHDIAGN